jgi:hypothetical protein
LGRNSKAIEENITIDNVNINPQVYLGVLPEFIRGLFSRRRHRDVTLKNRNQQNGNKYDFN